MVILRTRGREPFYSSKIGTFKINWISFQKLEIKQGLYTHLTLLALRIYNFENFLVIKINLVRKCWLICEKNSFFNSFYFFSTNMMQLEAGTFCTKKQVQFILQSFNRIGDLKSQIRLKLRNKLPRLRYKLRIVEKIAFFLISDLTYTSGNVSKKEVTKHLGLRK